MSSPGDQQKINRFNRIICPSQIKLFYNLLTKVMYCRNDEPNIMLMGHLSSVIGPSVLYFSPSYENIHAPPNVSNIGNYSYSY